MSYNPHIHNRRSIRLKGYDYSQAGLYFVTICCENREHRFGKIENDEMILNEFGMVAYNEWAKLPERFPNFELDVFQIMPNHMHGIIALAHVGAGLAPALNNTGQPQGIAPTNSNLQFDISKPDNNTGQPDHNTGQPQGIAPTTIGNIVGAYKSLVTNACIDICNSKNIRLGKLWQRNYHEHIIRNEQSYQTISDYIINNPAKWKDDKFY